MIPSQYGRLVFFLLLVTFITLSAMADKAAPQGPRFAGDTVLVKPRPGVTAAQMANHHAALQARVSRTFPAIGNLQVVTLPPGIGVDQALNHYRRSGLVAYAEPNYELQVAAVPNDPGFTQLWGMNNTGQTGGTADADIDAAEAWNTRTSAGNLIVAVIDTGIHYTHQDLAANIWTNPGESGSGKETNGIDDDGNGYVDDVHGINAITLSGDPMDDNGHGTHCSGTIGGTGNNGVGVAGVAWTVKLMGCKFLDAAGSGSTADAITCIDYARQMGAKVMSNSWSGGGFSQALYDAIASARDAGMLFVAAAGNSGLNTDSSPAYPSSYDLANIISVAATDHNDQRASFSNYGATSVDLGAPGVSIYSTYNTNDAGYNTLSGTSMACPHVAGAAALVWAHYPGLSYSQIKSRLLATTDPLAALAGLTVSGGRLNLHKALTVDPIADFTASPLSGAPTLTVNFVDTSLGTINSRLLDFGDGTTTTNTTTSHAYASFGEYQATLTVTGPAGTSTKTRTISVVRNYTHSNVAFNWIDTTAMASLNLADDAITTAISLPFNFDYYATPQTFLYIGSNGFILFGSNLGGTTWVNTELPNASLPNNIVCPYWDDLNPALGGTIRYGTAGTAPNRVFVVSWENISRYGDVATSLTFQLQLHENGQTIEMHYLDVKPLSVNGAGASGTVGVENSTGALGDMANFNTRSLANNSAYRFTYTDTPPTVCTIVCPSDPSAVNGTGQCGALVNYPSPTASGDCGAVNCSPASGSIFPVGSTPVSCTTQSGPSCGFTVNVSDTQLPTISCPSNVTATTTSSNGTTVTYGTPSVLDNCSGASASCTPASGSLFPIGSTTVTCTATDASTNSQSCSFTVTVNLTTCTPGAPASLTAIGSSRPAMVTLNWPATTCASGYVIERATERKGSFGSFTTIATVGPSQTSYTDTSVGRRKCFRYRVRATNGTAFSPTDDACTQ
jgi:subtilisin family serine protease